MSRVSSLKTLLPGPRHYLTARNPLRLNNNPSIYAIIDGSLDVFQVQANVAENSFVRRQYFSTFTTGDFLFGLPDMGEEITLDFLAVGDGKCIVVELSRSEFLSLVADSESYEFCKNGLEKWIIGLSTGVARHVTSFPNVDTVVEPGMSYMLIEGESIASRGRLTWVGMPEGSLHFCGLEDIEFSDQGVFFPLTKSCWIQAFNQGVIHCQSSAEIIQSARFWESLSYFYLIIFRCAQWNANLKQVDILNQLQDRVKNDSEFFRETILRMGGVLDSIPILKAHDNDDALIKASQLVARHQNIELDVSRSDMEPGADALATILRKASIRSRQVWLTDSWWLQDGGAMLGFIGDEKRPVALIPNFLGVYRMIDPITMTPQKLDAALAAQISSSAVVFYRPLPSSSLGARDILKFCLKGQSREITVVILATLALGALSTLIPYLVYLLFAHVIPNGNGMFLFELMLGFIVVIFGLYFSAAIRNKVITRILERADVDIQSALWDRILRLPMSFFSRFLMGDLAQRSLTFFQIRDVLTVSTVNSVLNLSLFVFQLAIIYFFSPAYFGVTVLTIVIGLGLVAYTGRFKARQNLINDTFFGNISGLIRQFISGMSKVRMFGAQVRCYSRWSERYSHYVRESAGTDYSFGLLMGMLNSSGYAGLIGLLFITDRLASLHVGEFLGAFTAFSIIFYTLRRIVLGFIDLFGLHSIVNRIGPIIEQETESKTGLLMINQIKGAIELSHLWFKYDDKSAYVLQDFSMKVDPGEFVAVIGPSGTGKSTIFRILLAFEQPQLGSVFYDGYRLDRLDIAAVRKKIGTVMQNSRLTSGTIYSNIVGTTDCSLDEVWQAAYMAGIDEDIQNMPMGLNTIVDEGGTTFSEGQRQRLLIARALISRPSVLLMDEATNSLDNRSNDIILNTLSNLQCTRIIITHRLGTLRSADRILLVNDGKVIKEGKFQTLMRDPDFLKIAEEYNILCAV